MFKCLIICCTTNTLHNKILLHNYVVQMTSSCRGYLRSLGIINDLTKLKFSSYYTLLKENTISYNDQHYFTSQQTSHCTNECYMGQSKLHVNM